MARFNSFNEGLGFNVRELLIFDMIKEEIGKLLSKIQPKYLLIHYGILERVFDKKKEDKIFIQLVEWANEFPNLDIIITSGRTRLEGLPTNVRFLNLAPLLTAVIDIRSKYVINKILNDSRI